MCHITVNVLSVSLNIPFRSFPLCLQVSEIEVCPDCYLSSCKREEHWFCQPCVSTQLFIIVIIIIIIIVIIIVIRSSSSNTTMANIIIIIINSSSSSSSSSSIVLLLLLVSYFMAHSETVVAIYFCF